MSNQKHDVKAGKSNFGAKGWFVIIFSFLCIILDSSLINDSLNVVIGHSPPLTGGVRSRYTHSHPYVHSYRLQALYSGDIFLTKQTSDLSGVFLWHSRLWLASSGAGLTA